MAGSERGLNELHPVIWLADPTKSDRATYICIACFCLPTKANFRGEIISPYECTMFIKLA